MKNETVEKAKADVKKGIAEVAKVATSLNDEVKTDVEMLKTSFGHNADVAKKSDATRILVTDAGAETKSDSENEIADAEVSKDTPESIFGVNAGIVWETLNLNGSMTIDDLVKATSLTPEEIYGALGWLGRENKISLETRGKVRFFSLLP